MPRDGIVKIVWARRFWRPLAVVFVIAAIIGWVAWPRAADYVLRANGHTYALDAAVTPEAKIKGLGGRPQLAADKGMLFVYDQSAPNRCFWMKDMRFPIDIIWLDGNKKVVHIEHSVQPASYPADFCAPDPSQFIIELNAGEAKQARINRGDTLEF